MWNLKYDPNRNRVTDIENRLAASRREGEGGMDWDSGICRCKLVCVGQTIRSHCIAQGILLKIL